MVVVVALGFEDFICGGGSGLRWLWFFLFFFSC